MICPNCGAKIDDDKLYCEVCGCEIQLIPNYEPEIEQSITDSLSELKITDLDVEEFPDFSDNSNNLNQYAYSEEDQSETYEYVETDSFDSYEYSESESNSYTEYDSSESMNLMKKNSELLSDNSFDDSDDYSSFDNRYTDSYSTDEMAFSEASEEISNDNLSYQNEYLDDNDYNSQNFDINSNVNFNEFDNEIFEDDITASNSLIYYDDNAYDNKNDTSEVRLANNKQKSSRNKALVSTAKKDSGNQINKKKSDTTDKSKKNVEKSSINNEKRLKKEEKEKQLRRKAQLEYIRHDNDKPRLTHSLIDSLYYEVPSEEELEFMNEELEYDPFDDFAYESYFFKKFLKLFKNKKTRPLVLGLMALIMILLAVSIKSVSTKIYQSSNFDYQIEQAKLAEEAGDYTTAISFMEKAIGINPAATSAKFDLADYYFKNLQDENGILILWDIINQKDYNAATAYKEIIDYYASQNDFDKIQEILLGCEDKNIVNQFQNYLALAPEFNFEEGTYGEEIYLEMSSLSDGKIYYTLDGTEPTRDSMVYNSPLFFEMGVHRVTAMFVNSYGVESDIVEKSYTVDIKVPKAPIVMLESGEYNEPQSIEVDYQSSCTVYYTTDGTVPNNKSIEYKSPITLPLGESHYIFVSYSQEGNPGEPTEVKYDFKVDSDFDIDVAVAQLNLYDYNIGRAADISGHLAGMINEYRYPISTIIWGEDKGDEKIEDLDAELILHPELTEEERLQIKEQKEKEKEEKEKEKEEKEKKEKDEKDNTNNDNKDTDNKGSNGKGGNTTEIDRDNNPNTKAKTNQESHEGQCLYYVFVEQIVDPTTGTKTKTGNIFLGKLDTGNIFCGKMDDEGHITVSDMIQPEFFAIPEFITNPPPEVPEEMIPDEQWQETPETPDMNMENEG